MTGGPGPVSVMIVGLRVVIAWGETARLEDLPPYSIALDGLVQGPALDLDAGRISFDHHGGCLRLVTSATCRQVLDALFLGLDPSLYTVYVNDVDGDTALAVALLAHPEWATPRSPHLQRVRALVETVGGRDAHGPAYPVADPALLAAFAASVPLPGRHEAAVDPAARLVRCVAAIADLVVNPFRSPKTRRPGVDGSEQGRGAAGPGRARATDGTFTVTHSGSDWVMATGEGDGFDPLYAAGYDRVVLWHRMSAGSVAYTVARRSDLVAGFPVGPPARPGTILGALAEREPGWGGGTSVGGAPRHADGSRSALTPDEVFRIVEKVVVAEADRVIRQR